LAFYIGGVASVLASIAVLFIARSKSFKELRDL
jgi:hypothetical protein